MPKKSKCGRTGDKHYVLSGIEDGAWRNHAAKVYSRQLCHAVADTFAEFWRNEFLEVGWRAAVFRP